MKNLMLSALFILTLITINHAQSNHTFSDDQELAMAAKNKMAKDNKITPVYNPNAISREPQFSGGSAALKAFFAKNIDYPEIARAHGIEGTVMVQVMISSEGTPSQCKIVKSISQELDEMAIKLVEAMFWEPALQNGTPIKCKMTVPVKFSL